MKSPAGAWQWIPTDPAAADAVPDAHDPSKTARPMMPTTDLALRMDPIYGPISQAVPREPGGVRRRLRPGVVQADAPRHGPRARYLGAEVPAEEQIWQDPIPAVTHELIRCKTSRTSRARFLHRDCPFPNWFRPPGRRRQRSAAL